MRALRTRAKSIADVPGLFEYPRDPNDERYVNLAITVQADYLVSRDNDILDLANAERPEARLFQTRFPHLKVVDPVAFLHVVQKRQAPR
jgi:predicted nucleic acid-binding protein